MHNSSPFTNRDLRSLQRVLRFVNTADVDIQTEAFRLARKLEKFLDQPKH